MAGKGLLITGGAGFLGYYLTRSVIHHNAVTDGPPIDLWVMDNFQRGVPDWLDRFRQVPDVRWLKHDVIEPVPDEVPDVAYIVHGASIASPAFYRLHPIETMDANVRGLRRLLDYCAERADGGDPVEGFLFFSTSEIYGDPAPEHIPTPETYRGVVSCTGPRACYDESKRFGETLCVNFHRQRGVPVTTVRPFNNYGPGLKISDRRLLPDFARRVLAGEDLVMHSDGSPTRTFCYVADAVVGYYQALVRGRRGEAYNIGSDGPEISVADFAERVVHQARDLFGYDGRVVRQASEDPEYLVDNPNRRCPDITKAREELGFEPEIDLDSGLRRSLRWYRHYPTAADL
ncbi:MAG: NAD-dependent epimerase/dehydratase family protein [Acidobacteriota bacterium]